MTSLVERNDQHRVIRQGRKYCWLSGWTTSMTPKDWCSGDWKLHIAHIASGSGKAHRVNDRRAVILLCPLAHMLHVSNSESHPTMSISGIRYPTIDERHTLWLKKKLDPEYYDPDYLKTIWIGNLPTPEPPPQRWQEEFYSSQGILW